MGSRPESPDRSMLDREELVARLGKGLRGAGLKANGVGALVVFVSLMFVDVTGDNSIPGSRYPEIVASFGALFAIGSVTAELRVRRSTRPYFDAIVARRPIAGRLREILLRTPWMMATTSFVMWGIAAAFFSTYTRLRFDFRTADAMELGAYILIAGLVTMAVVYLLTERVLRPAFALAFRDDPPRQVPFLSVRRRLILSWDVGAAVPLLAIATVVLDSENAARDFAEVQRVLLTFVGLAIIAGLVITSRLARSLAEPLDAVRGAMERVEKGDLATTVDVDDATEVGLVQAGFNRMVEGLRERERVRDLFGRHVGDEVAHQALERGVELGGEVTQASALFIDLVGS